MPRASYELRNGREEEFRELGRKAFRFVVLFSVPVTVYFMIFARPVIWILASELFAESVLPMRIILPTVILIGFSNILGLQILVPLGREKLVLYSEIAVAAADFVLNLILIPVFASSGAAAATVAAEAIVLTVQIVGCRRTEKEFRPGLPWKTVAAGTILGAACSFPALRIPAAFLAGCTGGVLFFGIYLAVLIAFRESAAVELLKALKEKIRKI